MSLAAVGITFGNRQPYLAADIQTDNRRAGRVLFFSPFIDRDDLAVVRVNDCDVKRAFFAVEIQKFWFHNYLILRVDVILYVVCFHCWVLAGQEHRNRCPAARNMYRSGYDRK